MLLIDTDMLVLLAASGLLERAVARLGFQMQDVRRLPAVPHQIRRSRSLRDQYGTSVLESILPLVEAIPEVVLPGNLQLLDRLNASMDPGEAQLLAVAAEQPGCLLLSGDKRAIEDLLAIADADHLRHMQGRIVTLEAVLLLLLEDLDSRYLHGALQVTSSHKTLRIVFSEINLSSDDGCRVAIRSYLLNLATESRGLLFDPEARDAATRTVSTGSQAQS